jgi:quercetin dioxygenase-like cupin family protein
MVREKSGDSMVREPRYKGKIEPMTGNLGADVLGPTNPLREAENPDILVPPRTDFGTMPNLKWAFADSHMRLQEGGWSRQTTIRELPAATTIAGVNMRLKAGAVREMHWHKEAEWAYMIKGKARITAVDHEGRTFQDDMEEEDLWYFPCGIPHSIQLNGWHSLQRNLSRVIYTSTHRFLKMCPKGRVPSFLRSPTRFLRYHHPDHPGRPNPFYPASPLCPGLVYPLYPTGLHLQEQVSILCCRN